MFDSIAEDIQPNFALLPWDEWLPKRRWFVRRGDAPEAFLTSLVVLGEVVACFVECGPDTYFVPLVVGAPDDPDGLLDDQTDITWVDALSDPDGVLALLECSLDKGLRGAKVRLVPEILDRTALKASLAEGKVVLGTAEQTNSWAMVGDTFMKVFRRLEDETNLDVEVLKALSSRGDLAIPKLRGVVSALGEGRESVVMAFQAAVPHERNAWNEACAQVASVAGANEAPIGIWKALGIRTAQLHLAMAEVFPTRASDEDDGTTVAAGMASLAREILSDLDRADRTSWTDSVKTLADAVRSGSGTLLARLGDPMATGTSLQRVHGDFHLGQVLLTGADWTILDFEGEPARTPAERRALAPVAKDVSGMLRSFDYASLAGLPAGADDASRSQVAAWKQSSREAFLEGYFGTTGIMSLWPSDSAQRQALLDRYEAEKAFYELRYELAHRPDWLAIPLGGLASLAKSRA
jgi:trehalose synthase-fused probable maltokinase